MRGPTRILVLALAAAPAGCGRKASAQPTEAPHRIHVDTVAIREQPMPRALLLTGTLRGERQTDLAAGATGRVVQTYVERGSEVKQGDLIARLDVRAAALSAAEADASARLAEEQRKAAKRECDRAEGMLASGAISRGEYDRIVDDCKRTPLSLTAAQARASAAAQMVGDGQIRAPFAGLVMERFVEPGEYVRPDTRVAALVSVDRLRLEFTVPEASIAAVTTGAALAFTVPAYPDRHFPGTVKFIGAAVRETTRDLVVEAEAPNADRALRPGMFAAIELAAGAAPMPVAPKAAVVAKEGGDRVFAVVDGRVEERVVQLGPSEGDVVGIARGLKAGDVVVAKPPADLQNGQAVE